MKTGLFLSVLIVSGSSSVNAGEWAVEVGAFGPKTDSWVTTNGLSGDEIHLDFEDNLNLEERQLLPYLRVDYKFKERHHVYADWRRLHRNAETKSTLGFTVPNHPDSAVLVGGKITTRFDIDILQIGYGYAFYQSERTELGLSAGLHIMFFELGFSGDIAGCINNSGVTECNAASTGGEIVDNSVTTPLPNLGFWGSYQLSDDFFLLAHPQFFYIDIDKFNGHLADINGKFRYHINSSWSVDLGYNYYLIQAKMKENTVKYTYQGPSLNVTYRF